MEEYAASHNLKFSTDPDPRKCKTKCLAYLKKPRELPSKKLCGNPLPWVDYVKHLGITVTNSIDGCLKDIMAKRAQYIQRSNELLQEFHFAHYSTKLKLNSVYNSHFSGSNCWDLTSRAGQMFEGTFNRNIKLTLNLPYPTHRNLLPVISQAKPLRITLAQRYLTFVEKLRSSEKPVLRHTIRLVENDTRTVTGRNLKNILLMTDRPDFQHLRLATWTLSVSMVSRSSGECWPLLTSWRWEPGNYSYLMAGAWMIWRSFFRPAVTNEKAQPVRSLTAKQSIDQASEKLNCTKAS